MIIIRNRWLPVGRRYYAINLFGIVFAKGQLSAADRNHEYIHTLQQREMLFIGFYIWYLVEWVIGLCRYRDSHKAYRQIRFEKEAYAHQHDLGYRHSRKHFSWFRII